MRGARKDETRTIAAAPNSIVSSTRLVVSALGTSRSGRCTVARMTLSPGVRRGALEPLNVAPEAWTAAGKWLQANAPAHASVACVPIGAVAYYSDLVVIDMLGLTDKHIARAKVTVGVGWAGHEKHDGKYVLARQPTYLLLGNVRVLDHALPIDHPEFVRIQHAAIEAREGDVYGRELVQAYEPAVANLGGGLFLHFLQRRR